MVHGVSTFAAAAATLAPDVATRAVAVIVLIWSTVTGFTLYQMLRFGPRVAEFLSEAARVASNPDADAQPLLDRLRQGAIHYKDLWEVVGKVAVPLVVAVIALLGTVVLALAD